MCNIPKCFVKFALIVFIELLHAQKYQQTNFSAFQKALLFYKHHKQEFTQAANGTVLNATQLFAIVAPEISRYDPMANWMELNSLRFFYVQFGKGYADFSIGSFQMKPSFIENMEDFVKHSVSLQKDKKVIKMNNPNTGLQRRKTIVDRLDNLDWQFSYLHLFSLIAEEKLSSLALEDKEEELVYFATMYNAGIQKSTEQLNTELSKQRFPREGRFKYNYADVAKEFYFALEN